MNNKRVVGSYPPPKISGAPSWTRFSIQAFKDFRSFLFMTGSLSLFRAILIFLFISKKDPDSGITDILLAMGSGFRFDSRVAMCFVLPTFLLSIVSAFFPIDRVIHRLRLVMGICFAILTLFLCAATIPYFKEYNDQFNSWIFGLIYDDFGAIVKTVWSQVPVIRGAIVLALIIMGVLFFLKKFLNREPAWAGAAHRLPTLLKSAATVVILCLVIFACRSSIWRRPVQLKDAAVTRDSFLNKTVLNPYEALRYQLSDYQESQKTGGIKKYLPDGDIQGAAKSYFNDSRNLDNIDDYMARTAAGGQGVLPRHIFLIVMESYDSWHMLDRYASLQTCARLKEIAGKGLWIKRFLPAYIGTTEALTTLISGLPDESMMINYQPSSRKPYPTSIAPIFKQLGYKTRFFYGGYLSWQRIEDFCRNQGFDEIYGAPHMGNWVQSNEWGVEDAALFAFIEKTIKDDEPSFSMVMTTSYHPPYVIDVYGRGYPVRKIPPDLAALYDGGIELKIFGHLWYADKCLGDFIHHMEGKFSAPVFAVTGDHWSRKFLNGKPALYERSSVPLVMYGPDVLKNKHLPENVVGGHIDIIPTLVELAAPKGFSYHALGRNLLSCDPAPLAFGAKNMIMTPQVVIENQDIRMVEPLPKGIVCSDTLQPPDFRRIFKRANQYYAIGWWRVMRGAIALPGLSVKTTRQGHP